MPKPVVAFFAVLRKVFGKAEDRRETVRDDACVTDEGMWRLHIAVEPDTLDGGFVAEALNVPGAVAQGETEKEALEALTEVIKDIIEIRVEQHFSALEYDAPPFEAEHRVHRFSF